MSDIIQQVARPLKKAFAANANTSAFTAKVATVTKPKNDGVIVLANEIGQVVPGAMRIFPYGLGSDNDTFSLRVWGWHRLGTDSPGNILWVPALLGEFGCTISTFVGVAGSPVLNTERFADTMTIIAGDGEATLTSDVTRLGTTDLFSPANNTPAWVRVRTHGAELIEFDGDQTLNTPTMNALIQFLAENY